MIQRCRLVGGEPEPVEDCPVLTYRSGNYLYRYEAACLSRVKHANAIPDGWYSRVRIEDGEIVEAQAEEERLMMLPDVCTGRTAEQDGISAAPVPGNLTSVYNESQILTTLVLTGSPAPGLALAGSGTVDNPLRINYAPSELRASLFGTAANVNRPNAGIFIEDGIVKAFPDQFVRGVKNNAPGAMNVYIDGDGYLVIEVIGYTSDGGTAPVVASRSVPCTTGGSMGSVELSVYQSGSIYVVVGRIVAGNDGQPSGWSPAPAAQYATLASAQSYMNSVSVQCPTPSA